VCGVDPEHADLTGRPHTETFQDLDRGGLPGSVRPQQDEHLAAVSGELDPVEDVRRAVPHPQVANVDHRVLVPAPRVPRRSAQLSHYGHARYLSSYFYAGR
jgi:hypothetical protein